MFKTVKAIARIKQFAKRTRASFNEKKIPTVKYIKVTKAQQKKN